MFEKKQQEHIVITLSPTKAKQKWPGPGLGGKQII